MPLRHCLVSRFFPITISLIRFCLELSYIDWLDRVYISETTLDIELIRVYLRRQTQNEQSRRLLLHLALQDQQCFDLFSYYWELTTTCLLLHLSLLAAVHFSFAY